MVDRLAEFSANSRRLNGMLTTNHNLTLQQREAEQRLKKHLAGMIGEVMLCKGLATHIILTKAGQDRIPTSRNQHGTPYQVVAADYTLAELRDDDRIVLDWPERMVTMDGNGYRRDGWLAHLDDIVPATPSEVARVQAEAELVR